MWLIVLVVFLLSVFVIFKSIRLNYYSQLFLVFCFLLIWNFCVLSDTKMWVFISFLLLIDVIVFKYKKIKIFYLYLIGLVLFVSLFLVISNLFISLNSVDNVFPESAMGNIKSEEKKYLKLEGVRMGDAYKGSFNALQACTVYKGKLYQFFNNGYYEIRNVQNMQIESEGRLDIPFEIHYGSVQFGDKIHKGCTMPYLYATDHVSSEGNVYVIDIEKHKIIQNYNVLGGSICAYDFSEMIGYLIDKDDTYITITPFNLVSGVKYKTMNIPFGNSIETLQTAVFHSDFIYVLSGYTGYSLILTKVNPIDRKIVDRRDYYFNGEPEGIFFRKDGKIVVTANVGSWTEGKGTDKYVHSEYVIIDSF